MSLTVLFESQTKLVHIFGLIFFCFVYFISSLVAEPVGVFFRISYLTGHILVNEFLEVWKFTVEALLLIYSFLQILHEDSVVFLKDANEKFTYAISLLTYVYLGLEEFAWICVRIISRLGEAIINAVGILQSTIIYLKYGIYIIGSTVREFVTHSPGVVILKVNAISAFISNTCNDFISLVFTFFDKILECLGKIYLFIFDNPLDLVYGLVICAVIVTIAYIKCKDTCLIISNVAVKSYKQIINFIFKLCRRMALKIRLKTINYGYDWGFENNERLCVVCQYQLKEMLLLPCKHLCVCKDCCLQLTNFLLNCPLCRSEIEDSLKVYL